MAEGLQMAYYTGGGVCKVPIVWLYEVPIVWLYKILNSISKKGHHVLVKERCVYKVLNSKKNCTKVVNSKRLHPYRHHPLYVKIGSVGAAETPRK